MMLAQMFRADKRRHRRLTLPRTDTVPSERYGWSILRRVLHGNEVGVDRSWT